MSQQAGSFAPEPWIAELSAIEEEEARRRFLARQGHRQTEHSVQALLDGVAAFARFDLAKAERLAQAITWVAMESQDPYTIAQSHRAGGHVHYLNGRYPQAIREYETAITELQKLGRHLDAGSTISAALQSLIYDGQYDKAYQLGEQARAIFEAAGDRLRLARLDTNMANVYYRQDRFQEAGALYERACEAFREVGDPLEMAIVLRNLAVCYISLNEFAKAQETYQLARQHSEKHGFSLVVAESDYNVAYLYYLRGEYLRAIEMYDQTRARCKQLGDKYHQALCDLDQSEIYLELNLTEGGTELAQEAFAAFSELGMRYEAAKAATFSAIAVSQQGHYRQALQIFDRARDLFINEQNKLWPALIDLYKALVLYEAGDNDAAEDLAFSALEYFAPSFLPAKAALCELLLAGIELRSSDSEEARRHCSSALARLLHIESPTTYQAYFMLGQAEEGSGNTELARQAYEKAYHKLESLRSHLGKEELKIAFVKNKLTVYESLVLTSLAVHSRSCTEHDTFQYIEQAKSRSLADLIAFRASSLSARNLEHAPAMARFRDLRQKLNWTYHEIELQELSQEGASQTRIRQLRQQSREHEDALVKAFSQLQSVDYELASLQSSATISARDLQKILPAGSMLVEFYAARDRFYVCLASRERLKILPAAEVGPVREKLRLLQLQLAKFRLGEEYIRPLEKRLLQATQSHLEELYALLIAPIRAQLEAEHLIIVPHTFLHYLPFHALSDGKRHLIDDFSISYAPSGSIFAVCHAKQHSGAQNALVLAVPDARAPYIEQEGRMVADTMESATLFLGEEATEERLRSLGPQSRFIHIATHGYFREDNPMFSSIRLGNSLLSLFDLYQLQLNAELVTLSGCGTGMNVVVGGDELIGLVRGLLYAGAQTLMVSLWEVHDERTAEFMRDFYSLYSTAHNKAEALRQAIFRLREKHPHPYYWAAFALVGKFM